MNIDGLFLKRQGAEGIAEEKIEFFVNVLLDLFPKNFILSFLFKFELVFDIPARGKDSDISRRHFFNGLSNHFVLEVEGLHRSWNEIITTYQFLFVLFVLLIFLPDVGAFFVVRGGWKVESKNGRGLFK